MDGVLKEGNGDTNWMGLVYQKDRLAILKNLAEKNDTPSLLALKLEIPQKKVWKHISILLKFGLIEKLQRAPSPFNPQRKSKYQVYRIAEKGMKLLEQYEKKPARLFWVTV
jgi:DNA-binding transcriptional ArsR family regulator